jgi:hypothetical protein
MRLAFAGLLLLVAAAVGFYVYIDVVAGKAIETGASYALGVDTEVGFARVGLLSGSFRIGGLKVANPSGFASKHLLSVDDARLAVALDSLQQDVVSIRRFALEGVAVALEKTGGKTNYGVILAHLKRNEGAEAKRAPVAPAEERPGKRFVVKELVIRGISAHVAHNEALGAIGGIDVTVPEVRLTNVGAEGGGGVAMSELSAIIVKAVFESIARYGTGLPSALAGDLRSNLGGLARVPVQLVGASKDAVVNQLPTPVGDAARGVTEGAGKALKGLGGLLGGDRRDD